MHLKVIALKYAEGILPGRLVIAEGNESNSVKAPFLFYLIQLDDKNILVDVGGKDMPGYYDKYRKPLIVLNEYGLQSTDIDYVIITHAHSDHIEELYEYKHATIYIQEDELTIGLKNGYISKEYNVQSFQEETILLDILKIKKIGGHTKGSSIVSFLHDEHEYVLCGDECYIPECFTQRIPTGNSYNPENSKDFINKYSNLYYKIFTFHDPNILLGKNGFQVIFEADLNQIM